MASSSIFARRSAWSRPARIRGNERISGAQFWAFYGVFVGAILRQIGRFAIAILLLLPNFTAAQGNLPDGRVTALWSDGSRLLIGQESALTETLPTTDDLNPLATWDLSGESLRDAAICLTFRVVLTSDGLRVLNSEGRALDVLRGGGQRLACNDDMLYIAALEAGIRRFRLNPSGTLTSLPPIKTTGAVWGVIITERRELWAAEGDSGVGIYSTDGSPRLRLDQIKPAYAIFRRNGQVLVGHGGAISVLEAGSDQPTLVASSQLLIEARITDLTALGARIYAAVETPSRTGIDLIAVQLGANQLTLLSQVGVTGAGTRVVLWGEDIFLAASGGLRRIRFVKGTPQNIAEWGGTSTPTRCTAAAPIAPEPEDNATIPTGAVRLSWRGSCASQFEIRVDGRLFAMIDAADAVISESEDDIRYGYVLEEPPLSFTWQVVAVDSGGARVSSPIWRLQMASEGILKTPQQPIGAPIYQPPIVAADSPEATILTLCGSLALGLLVIVGFAWLLGRRVQRRRGTWSR